MAQIVMTMLATAKQALSVGAAGTEGARDESPHALDLGPVARSFRTALDALDLLSRAVLISCSPASWD
jgi:hypothetical protein